MKKALILIIVLYSCAFLKAQSGKIGTIPPALAAIQKEDLKKDLYDLAGAHFNGRSGGTLDELKASMWIGEKYRALGLKPAGDDGTYFQFFNLWRTRVSEQTVISINNKPLKLWKDIAISQMAQVNIDAPIVYLGNAATVDDKIDVTGKVVAMDVAPNIINYNMSLPTWRYSRTMLSRFGNPLIKKGAIAIIFIADAVAESTWEDANANFMRGNYDIEGGSNAQLTTTVPVLWVHETAKIDIAATNNPTIKANIQIEHFQYPSVNVVGKLDGTDPILKNEYLLYSGHQDAHGIRNPIKGDTIYYGADDNGSVDVAIFACVRAFKKNPSKRSILVVMHGSEERGLLGSKWYSAHPTVPINNIVTVLNGDMIGRNHPDSAALLGTQPPHLNSSELAKMAFDANNEGPKFKLDTLWDKPNHVEGWYFRSDHLPYARLGIPALMYTTLLHPDYHTPQDDASRIDYDKLKKMAEWMYRTGWKVANAPQRPAREPNFRLER